jgi:hypothetical protein
MKRFTLRRHWTASSSSRNSFKVSLVVNGKGQTPGEAIESRRWTGDPASRSASSRNEWLRYKATLLITVPALTVLIVCLINRGNLGKTKTAVGTITGNSFVPPQSSGTTHWGNCWSVRVRVNEEDGGVCVTDRPPAWVAPGNSVVVQYVHGWVDANLMIRHMRPVSEAAQPGTK